MIPKTPKSNISFLSGGGEMGELIRQKDWRKTLVGVPEKWPQSLRTTLSIILHSKFPMFLFWGPDLICFYNDAYRPSLGNDGKHPDILGSRAEDYWAEIWADIKPLIDQVLAGGEANWNEDQLLPIYRNGKMEDVYWTFSYSAVNDESGKPAGVFVTCNETTKQVTALKRLEESEESFHTLADNMSQFAWMADEKGWIYWYNQRWYDYTGTTLEEMQGWGWQKVHHPEHVDRVVKNIKHSWDTGEIWEDTFPLRGQDGQYRWFLSRAVPIKDADGKVLRWFGTNTDITTQKMAAEKIRTSEERFRQLADHAPMWVWITDLEINVLYANYEVLNFIGISHYSEFTGQMWQNLVHPDEILSVIEHFSDAIAQQTSFEFEARVKSAKTGNYEWFYLKGVPRVEADIFTGFIGTAININEQKNQLVKIQQSEENFRQLSDLMPEKVSRSDSNGNVIYYNQSWLDYTGFSFEDLKDWGWAQAMHPHDIVELTKLWTHSVMTGDDFEMDFRILNKAGQYRWHLCRSAAIKDAEGNIKNWVGVTIDIEQQKSFARELEQQVATRTNELRAANDMLLHQNELLTASENFNRSLTEVSPTMVYIHDIEKNKPVFLNNTYLNFVGYNWDKVEQLDDKFISAVVHPDDLAFCNELLQKVITSEEGAVFEGNFRRKNAYGIWVPFLNRLTAFKRNSKNEVTQIIGVAIDISDLKKAEDFLQQKNQDLENMNKELQSFAYISSHDLQEPLRKIQTFANRIVEKEYNNLSNTGKDYFKKMEHAAHRMRTLIDDLLAYSRTNMQERKFEKANLADIVEEVRLEFAEELEKKQAIFEAKDLCECNVIPFQMRQLVHNLLSNAIKFAHPNRPPHIKIKSEIAKGLKFQNQKLESEKEYCHIHITDNGIGFEQQYNEKIFEVFQRLHGKEKYGGTGIGLSIVKKIVDNHNGIITAKGELNKGATFDIYIPST
jgi:PAS domain S-box-containing protein